LLESVTIDQRPEAANRPGSQLVIFLPCSSFGQTLKSDNLIWIDLEMTGLDTQADHIIEIATIVTDSSLRVVAEGPVIAIHQEEAILTAMDEWNRTTHGGTGLLHRIRDSRFTARDAEAQTLAFLEQHSVVGTSPMCGNSICQDRRFLAREMPVLEKFFHYRNLDVSTVKELARRWAPAVLAGVEKSSTHLALDDIRESIKELEHYRRHFFRVA
jgi:oligoribonuclease